MKTSQVFVSHTSDLAAGPAGRSFVQAALDAVVRAGMTPVDMRYFAARDGRPADYCRARVRQCEAFVAVVGFRYGSLVPGRAVSYTELEFEEATAAGLPRLVFLLDDADRMAPGLADADRGEAERFRQRLRDTGLVVRGFATSDGLELEVFHALSELPGARGSAPAAGVAAATRTLPRDVASFTGRDPELSQLVREVAGAADSGGVVGICAIGGMAGIGKTAFAVHAAHLLASRFPAGQIFLPLHGHTPGHRPVDPADALASLLQAAGVAAQHIPAGLEERAWLWRDRLAGQRLLLLLDDAAGHEQVRPLLPGTAGSLVLVTSRRHLTALEDTQTISLGILSPGEAGQLLIRLAARPGMDPRDDAVSDITRLCGYLPLAIGMLARQLHHHPAWTAAGLATDLRAARSRLAMMHAENLSVTAAFDLSYQDLTPGQQRLFRRLGLHPGTDIDSYAAAALDDTDLTTARHHLEGLYDHYLLTEPTRGRYRFHDLISEHARALATTDPPAERDAAMDRLLGYYLHTARTAGHHLARRTSDGPPAVIAVPPAHAPDLPAHQDALTWMDTELVNLHAAVQAAAGGHPGYAIAIPAAMHGYLRHHGHWDQVLTFHHSALDAAHRTGDEHAEANALTDLGDIQHLNGDYAAAAGSLTRAVEEHCGQGNQHGEANALAILGRVQHLTGDNRAAATSLTGALELHRANADRLGEAGTLAYLSHVQLADGSYPAAKANLMRALELLHGLGIGIMEAGIHNFLGVVQQAMGDYQAAIASQTRARDLYRDLGNRLGEATATRDLGIAQQAAADYPAATASLTRALELHRELGFRSGEARGLHSLGVLQRLAGQYPASTTSLARALELYCDLGQKLGEAEVLNAIGELSLASGSPADAQACHEQALAIATSSDSLPEEARALEGIARCQLQDGQATGATVTLHQALAIYQRIGSPNTDRVQKAIRDHGL